MKKLLLIVLASYIGSSVAKFTPAYHPCIKFMEELRKNGLIAIANCDEDEFTECLENQPQDLLHKAIEECEKIKEDLNQMLNPGSTLSLSNQKLIRATLRVLTYKRYDSLQESFNRLHAKS